MICENLDALKSTVSELIPQNISADQVSGSGTIHTELDQISMRKKRKLRSNYNGIEVSQENVSFAGIFKRSKNS